MWLEFYKYQNWWIINVTRSLTIYDFFLQHYDGVNNSRNHIPSLWVYLRLQIFLTNQILYLKHNIVIKFKKRLGNIQKVILCHTLLYELLNVKSWLKCLLFFFSKRVRFHFVADSSISYKAGGHSKENRRGKWGCSALNRWSVYMYYFFKNPVVKT